ncbi:MAG: hypothetical protein HYW52_10825 [Gemmatimonadetes bacterium]|nr:hypothetical protein [Gemmatimonadota bacterium]
MTEMSRTLLLWSPRVLGILVSLFLGMFALDAFSEGKGLVLVELGAPPGAAACQLGPR